MTVPAADVDALAHALAREDRAPLDAALAALGAPPPLVLWDPKPEFLPDPRLVALHAYWTAMKAGGRVPRLDDVDPIALETSVVGYVMLLEALPKGDFRYRLYGSKIAERSGFEMTGKRTSEIRPKHPFVALLHTTIYRAATLRRVPVFTFNLPPPGDEVLSWSRLILPMEGKESRVDFLVGNIPGEPRPIV